jgi:hypothetical protein
MPWVKQYMIGTGFEVQRETPQDVVDDIRPSMGDHNISEFPFPRVRVWDQEHEVDRAVRLLRHLCPEKLANAS